MTRYQEVNCVHKLVYLLASVWHLFIPMEQCSWIQILLQGKKTHILKNGQIIIKCTQEFDSQLMSADYIFQRLCFCYCHDSNNYFWRRSSMIARIIMAKVSDICRDQRLRRITQTKALIILLSCKTRNTIIIILWCT